MKTPYLDEQINELEIHLRNNDLSVIGKKELTEFKKIKEVLTLGGVVATLPKDPIVLARYLHEEYEMIAKKQNWSTQENCKVDFIDLPVENKKTMILLAGKIILDFGGN